MTDSVRPQRPRKERPVVREVCLVTLVECNDSSHDPKATRAAVPSICFRHKKFKAGQQVEVVVTLRLPAERTGESK